MKKWCLILVCIPHFILAQGPFEPGAQYTGTSAIHKDSAIFIAWASSGSLEPGWIDIAQPQLGKVSPDYSQNAFGIPDNQVVSLGDAGSYVISLDQPLVNGPGPDFAIFENGFGLNFLELATVSVSTDSAEWIIFPAISLTDTNTQIGTFGSLVPEHLDNLAGKYEGGYGTPFDLSEVAQSINLINQEVRFIKITDVVGSITSRYGTRDANGVLINDPYPTPFPSSGFDLDAIGIIHNSQIEMRPKPTGKFYPNPAQGTHLYFNEEIGRKVSISDLSGKLVMQTILKSNYLELQGIQKGSYILKLDSWGKGELLIVQ